MEILPHFWIGHFKKNIIFLKEKKIESIIHLSKNESFLKCKEIEQIRIPIDYKDDFSIDDKNTVLYQHLFDVTDFIHEKIISNKNILLLGYDNIRKNSCLRYDSKDVRNLLHKLKNLVVLLNEYNCVK